jgi:hypothetical protein
MGVKLTTHGSWVTSSAASHRIVTSARSTAKYSLARMKETQKSHEIAVQLEPNPQLFFLWKTDCHVTVTTCGARALLLSPATFLRTLDLAPLTPLHVSNTLKHKLKSNSLAGSRTQLSGLCGGNGGWTPVSNCVWPEAKAGSSRARTREAIY